MHTAQLITRNNTEKVMSDETRGSLSPQPGAVKPRECIYISTGAEYSTVQYSTVEHTHTHRHTHTHTHTSQSPEFEAASRAEEGLHWHPGGVLPVHRGDGGRHLVQVEERHVVEVGGEAGRATEALPGGVQVVAEDNGESVRVVGNTAVGPSAQNNSQLHVYIYYIVITY